MKINELIRLIRLNLVAPFNKKYTLENLGLSLYETWHRVPSIICPVCKSNSPTEKNKDDYIHFIGQGYNRDYRFHIKCIEDLTKEEMEELLDKLEFITLLGK